MTESEFKKLSNELRSCVNNIPKHWGAVQNDKFDSDLNVFEIYSFEELERMIANLPTKRQMYNRRRWFIRMCSKCDEYLFYVNKNVTPNPNTRSKKYDIVFNGKLYFDVKCSVIPGPLLNDVEKCIADPKNLIKHYYEHQSNGVRHHFQNRLFIVHHSFIQPERELLLRCAWGSKEGIYKFFSENIANMHFEEYNGCTATTIFILERERGKVSYVISGLE